MGPSAPEAAWPGGSTGRPDQRLQPAGRLQEFLVVVIHQGLPRKADRPGNMAGFYPRPLSLVKRGWSRIQQEDAGLIPDPEELVISYEEILPQPDFKR